MFKIKIDKSNLYMYGFKRQGLSGMRRYGQNKHRDEKRKIRKVEGCHPSVSPPPPTAQDHWVLCRMYAFVISFILMIIINFVKHSTNVLKPNQQRYKNVPFIICDVQKQQVAVP